MILQELYEHPDLTTCPHLARLTSKGMYLHGKTLVLHLEPVGVPQRHPPADEATLKQAVGGVLKGLVQLHRAGEMWHCLNSCLDLIAVCVRP